MDQPHYLITVQNDTREYSVKQIKMPISDSGLDEISPALRRTNITFLVISGVATISMAI